jgi:hypothetical protein
MERVKAALMPCIYAAMMPGICSGGNTVRSSEAPVAMRRAPSTPGADTASLANIRLTKAAWAAATVKAPPTVWKTRPLVSLYLVTAKLR